MMATVCFVLIMNQILMPVRARPTFVTWLMVWDDSNQPWWNASKGFDGAFFELEPENEPNVFVTPDWANETEAGEILDLVKDAGIDAVIVDLTNEWGAFIERAVDVLGLCRARGLDMAVAMAATGNLTEWDLRIGQVEMEIRAKNASAYLMVESKPVLVLYAVRDAFDAMVECAKLGKCPNAANFDLVWSSGEDTNSSKWGWQLEPFAGPQPSSSACFATPSIKYPDHSNITWRKSISFLDYSMHQCLEFGSKVVIIGAYDDIPEHNSWALADTLQCDQNLQLRDPTTGNLSVFAYYNRVKAWTSKSFLGDSSSSSSSPSKYFLGDSSSSSPSKYFLGDSSSSSSSPSKYFLGDSSSSSSSSPSKYFLGDSSSSSSSSPSKNLLSNGIYQIINTETKLALSSICTSTPTNITTYPNSLICVRTPQNGTAPAPVFNVCSASSFTPKPCFECDNMLPVSSSSSCVDVCCEDSLCVAYGSNSTHSCLVSSNPQNCEKVPSCTFPSSTYVNLNRTPRIDHRLGQFFSVYHADTYFRLLPTNTGLAATLDVRDENTVLAQDFDDVLSTQRFIFTPTPTKKNTGTIQSLANPSLTLSILDCSVDLSQVIFSNKTSCNEWELLEIISLF